MRNADLCGLCDTFAASTYKLTDIAYNAWLAVSFDIGNASRLERVYKVLIEGNRYRYDFEAWKCDAFQARNNRIQVDISKYIASDAFLSLVT